MGVLLEAWTVFISSFWQSERHCPHLLRSTNPLDIIVIFKGLLYASPFIDINPRGVDGVFDSTQVAAIISTLQDIRQRAVA
jgi:hypothetical protein